MLVSLPNESISFILCFVCSEWVLGTREDLAKDIISELQPENGEVRVNLDFIFLTKFLLPFLLIEIIPVASQDFSLVTLIYCT